MVVQLLRHTKADWDNVKKSGIFGRGAICAKVCASVENELILANCKLRRRKDLLVGSAVIIRCERFQQRAISTVNAEQFDLHPLGGASPSGVEDMGREITGHLSVS